MAGNAYFVEELVELVDDGGNLLLQIGSIHDDSLPAAMRTMSGFQQLMRIWIEGASPGFVCRYGRGGAQAMAVP
jgi:hypothetical protein